MLSVRSLELQTPLQDVGMPSWGAPQDQPVHHAMQAARKRKAAEMDFFDDSEDSNVRLAPYRPSGRTLGGDRPIAPPFTGQPVELRPAYTSRTIVQLPSEQLQLAVPAVKAHQSFKWDNDGEDAEVLEYRNFADRASENFSIAFLFQWYGLTWRQPLSGPSEVSQSNSKGKVQWLDYVPTAIVAATFAPNFSAISCEDSTLSIYSPSGRQ